MKKNLMIATLALLACAVGCKSGSKNVEKELAALNEWNQKFETEFKEKAAQLEATPEAFEEYADSAFAAYIDYNKAAFDKNAANEVGVAALKNLYGAIETDEIEEMLGKLTAEVHGKDSAFVYGLKESLAAKKKTAEGMMFTDFEVDGVKFSDFIGKGKYVLVDFWASWCGPCRGEMPNLRAVYDEFHGDKFDMLSVAVWDKPEDTAKAAEEEKIVWNQIVNAQKIPTDIYGIEGIPHIILFGPDGTILKRNLRGDGIREAVAEALAD